MRLESWFISNPDESQQKVLNVSPDESLVVIGAAGSGKTNMAIYRANQAGDKPFIIVVYTIALKKMVSFGLAELSLDNTRVVHEWSWKGRGIDVPGDVFGLTGQDHYGLNNDILILLTETGVDYFIFEQIYERIIASGKYLGYKVSEPEDSLRVSIDFDEWVEDRFYYTYYRRQRWFRKIKLEDFDFNPDSSNVIFIPSAFLFKETGELDHLIIDEGQDFSIYEYKNSFVPKTRKALTIFGDSNQLIYSNRGTSMTSISKELNYKTLVLSFNYRIPKTVALIAQNIVVPPVDLISKNKKNGGNSSYPVFRKPVIKKCKSWTDELDFILTTIELQDLDDVGILLSKNEQVQKVHRYFQKRNIDIQVRYSVDLHENIQNGIFPKFKVVDTLDFTNNDLPCVLTFHSAKGTEFDNVFIPFANHDEVKERNAFYVAVTRTNANLYISYSRQLTPFLDRVSSQYYEHIKN